MRVAIACAVCLAMLLESCSPGPASHKAAVLPEDSNARLRECAAAKYWVFKNAHSSSPFADLMSVEYFAVAIVAARDTPAEPHWKSNTLVPSAADVEDWQTPPSADWQAISDACDQSYPASKSMSEVALPSNQSKRLLVCTGRLEEILEFASSARYNGSEVVLADSTYGNIHAANSDANIRSSKALDQTEEDFELQREDVILHGILQSFALGRGDKIMNACADAFPEELGR